MGNHSQCRLPTRNEAWIYPLLRFHTQTTSDYFDLPARLERQASGSQVNLAGQRQRRSTGGVEFDRCPLPRHRLP